MTNWLDRELSRQLAPVAAPDMLWERIHEQHRPLRVRPRQWKLSVAAAALLMLAAGLVWKLERRPDRSTDLQSLASKELHGITAGFAQPDFRSEDPKEIRKWVRSRLNIDVQMPEESAPVGGDVRLIGARLIQSGEFSGAAITYRVGDHYAAMLVTDRPGGTAGTQRHAGPPVQSASGVRMYSWSEGRQEYAIAYGGSDSRGPCLLCHAGTPALMVFR